MRTADLTIICIALFAVTAEIPIAFAHDITKTVKLRRGVECVEYQITSDNGKKLRSFPESEAFDSVHVDRKTNELKIKSVFERTIVPHDSTADELRPAFLLFLHFENTGTFSDSLPADTDLAQAVIEQRIKAMNQGWHTVTMGLFDRSGKKRCESTKTYYSFGFYQHGISVLRVGNNGRVAVTGILGKDDPGHPHLVVFDTAGKELFNAVTDGEYFSLSPNIHLICTRRIDDKYAAVIDVDRAATDTLVLKGYVKGTLYGASLNEPTDSTFRIEYHSITGKDTVHLADTTARFDDIPRNVLELWK